MPHENPIKPIKVRDLEKALWLIQNSTKSSIITDARKFYLLEAAKIINEMQTEAISSKSTACLHPFKVAKIGIVRLDSFKIPKYFVDTIFVRLVDAWHDAFDYLRAGGWDKFSQTHFECGRIYELLDSPYLPLEDS